MSEYTSAFNMKLPDETDYFDIEDFNGNTRIIDEKLSDLEEKIEDLREHVTKFEQTGYPVASIEQAVADWCSEHAVGVQSDTITMLFSTHTITERRSVVLPILGVVLLFGIFSVCAELRIFSTAESLPHIVLRC